MWLRLEILAYPHYKCSKGELQNLFQIEENGNSFMIGCFTVWDEVLELREALEKPCNFAKMC